MNHASNVKTPSCADIVAVKSLMKDLQLLRMSMGRDLSLSLSCAWKTSYRRLGCEFYIIAHSDTFAAPGTTDDFANIQTLSKDQPACIDGAISSWPITESRSRVPEIHVD